MTTTNTAVTIQYHFDAVSIWIQMFGFEDQPGKHARGKFGVNVGAKRILNLHDQLDLPATWFVPGHTIESFPEICGRIWDEGYPIEHHGWTHVPPSQFEDREEEKNDFERGIDAICDLTGRRPEGYSSTAWDYSEHTLGILQELGFKWDTSLMAGDFKPYYVRDNWKADPNEPYDPGEETDILEFPVSWKRDDWPPFQFEHGIESQGAAPDEKQIFDMWREQFDYMYEHVDDGVFNMTFHPQVIGEAPRPRYLQNLFTYMLEKPGVEFMTFNDAYDKYKDGAASLI